MCRKEFLCCIFLLELGPGNGSRRVDPLGLTTSGLGDYGRGHDSRCICCLGFPTDFLDEGGLFLTSCLLGERESSCMRTCRARIRGTVVVDGDWWAKSGDWEAGNRSKVVFSCDFPWKLILPFVSFQISWPPATVQDSKKHASFRGIGRPFLRPVLGNPISASTASKRASEHQRIVLSVCDSALSSSSFTKRCDSSE